MKLTSLVQRLALVAVAAFSLTSASATPTTHVPAYTPGDLLLGFYDTTGAVTNDYVVDLGPITNFSLTTSFVLLSSTTHMGTDLNDIFGTGPTDTSWYNSGNIVFGLAVAYPLTGQVYVTNPNDGTPWTENAHQGGETTAIGDVGSQYSLSTQTSEQDPRGLEQSDSANSNTWYAQETAAFGGFSSGGGDGFISDLTSNSIEFDLVNQVSPSGSPSTDLGSFFLDSSGDLTFIPVVSVPEPSTLAVFGIGALSLAAFRRRRRA